MKIVPITIGDNKKKFPQEYFKGSAGMVRIKVHAPTKIDKNKSSENLNSTVYNTIFEQLKNYEDN